MDKSLVRISKLLSLVLRHKPQTIDLSLAPGGWAEVDELLIKAKLAGIKITYTQLEQVVDRSDKKRFTLSNRGRLIRPNHGHSIDINLNISPVVPPQTLFHGTAERFLKSIMTHCLMPGKRNFVHLSSDKSTACEVGKRHGKPFVLTIKTEQMHAEGFTFYCSASSIWLTVKVPVMYIMSDIQ